MKQFTLKPIIIALLSTLLIGLHACGDDEDSTPPTNLPETPDLEGDYRISEVTLNEALSSENGASLPAGTDMTLIIQGAFLAGIDCPTEEEKVISLESDNKVAFRCTSNDTRIEQGSWSYDEDDNILQLTLSIPTSPIPIPLTLNNLVQTDTTIAGDVTSIPLPPMLIAVFFPEFASAPEAALLANVNIVMDRVP